MSKIIIRGLKVMACHGVKDFEKVEKQPFIFDADVFYDFYSAYETDDLGDTINYSAVSKIIVGVATNNCFDLIEKLAYEAAFAVLENVPASRIDLTVYKPNAPMKLDFDTVGVSVSLERTTALLSLGSSLGDRRGTLEGAVEMLKNTTHVQVKRVSDMIETEPYGGAAENKFINCAVMIETLLPPKKLLNVIHEIENSFGRTREKRWGDRTLDIDIVFFGNKVIASDGLIVPHPDYMNRSFVLEPLKQIAPDFVCPLLRKQLRDI